MKKFKCWSDRYEYEPDAKTYDATAPDDREYEASRKVGAVKRASLDLQMVLIDLRMNRL